MHVSRRAALLLLVILTGSACAQRPVAHPRDGEIKNPDTLAWWHITEALSGDNMEGRDTGSAGYDRAAKYVADRFAQAGLKPAGDNGTFFQELPLFEVQVKKEGTSFTLLSNSGKETALKFLQEISIRASDGSPTSLEAPLIFAGYCAKGSLPDVSGKIAVCFGTHRSNLVNAAERGQALIGAGAKAMIVVDDPYFTLEPARWPVPYSRTVTTTDPRTINRTAGIPSMTLSAATFGRLLDGTRKNADTVLAAGGRGELLESFEIPAKLRVRLNVVTRAYTSKNILAILPGTDPKLKDEYLALSAHLDGYGYGEPVNGDDLYNGALDDAAYVALLVQFADRQHQKDAKPLRRSVLICAFTGEEKGLLGSRWFTHHPTVAVDKIVADINLDQLRPLFPLNILTALAVDRSTLGAAAREVAAPMHIEVRPDPEPERNLLTRADHWPFMEVDVPAIGFIFGYDPGTGAEKRYREWYQVRYHRPQDDLTQPVDFDAATKFNEFFYRLAGKLANDDKRPEWNK